MRNVLKCFWKEGSDRAVSLSESGKLSYQHHFLKLCGVWSLFYYWRIQWNYKWTGETVRELDDFPVW